MKIEFKCNYCEAIFEPKYDLLEAPYSCCPYCASVEVELTIHTKLMFNRKEKLTQLNDTRRINTKNK